MKTKGLSKALFIPGMLALLSVPARAENPPVVEINDITVSEAPSINPFDLVDSLNTITGQITVETYVNQWTSIKSDPGFKPVDDLQRDSPLRFGCYGLQ